MHRMEWGDPVRCTLLQSSMLWIYYSLESVGLRWQSEKVLEKNMNKSIHGCRLCLNPLSNNKFEQLSTVKKEVLDLLLHSVDVSIVNEPLICHPCLECIRNHCDFIMNCLDVEQKIVLYLTSGKGKGSGDLFDVLKFSIKRNAEEEFMKHKFLDDFKINFTQDREHNDITEPKNDLIGINKGPNETVIVIKNNINASTSKRRRGIKSIGKDQVVYYGCDMCSFKTAHKSNLHKHKMTHKDPAESVFFDCDVCTFKTRYKRNLKSHKMTHKNPEETILYECNACTYKTIRKDTLHRHMVIHKNSQEMTFFQCDLCTYTTSLPFSLEQHRAKHKNPEEVYLQCDKCSYKSKNRGDFRKHKLIHINPEESHFFGCDLCPYKAKRKDSLQRHMIVHKDPKEALLFKCELCPFTTKHKSNIRIHKSVHQNPEETVLFECSTCAFKTKDKYYIGKHVLIHQK